MQKQTGVNIKTPTNALIRIAMFDKKEFRKKLITLVLPISFQQFMLAVVSASDAVMLGAIDQNAMSAVSIAGQVQFVFNLFIAAMTIGTSMFAAQFWGCNDKTSIEKLTAIVYAFTLPVAALFTVLTAAAPAPIMRIFTNEAAIIEYGAKYLRAVSLSYFFCGISQIYLCAMKNSARAFKGSLIASVCVIINIALNALFIFGWKTIPALGVVGAAIATVAARFIEAVWALSDGIKKGRVKIRPEYIINADKAIRKDFIKHTLPILGNEIVWGIGFTAGTIIIGRLGADAIAANSIANTTKNLLVCFSLGLGAGGGILVGNEIGAGNTEKAKTYGDKLCKLSILSGVLTGALILALTPLIAAFAKLTTGASGYLKQMLAVCAYYVIGKSINSMTIGGIFCAGGDSKFGFLCDAITLWGIVVPLSLIAAFALKLPVMAVYVVINLDEIIKLPAVYKHYKRYKWVKDLTRKGEKHDS